MTTDADRTSGGSSFFYWLKRIWPFVRPLIIPLLCLVGLYVGLVIGYVYIGKQPASDIDKWSTWKHLVDLVFG